MSPRNDIANILKGFIGLQFDFHAQSQAKKSDFIQRWRQQQYTGGSIDKYGNWTCNQATDDDMAVTDKFYLYQSTVNSSGSKKCTGLNFSDTSSDGSNINYETFYAYDATVAFAYGLHQLLQLNSAVTGKALRSAMINKVSFEGITGKISFSKGHQGYGEGSRQDGIKVNILNFQPSQYISQNQTSGFASIGKWTSDLGFIQCDNCPIVFNTPSNTPPSDSPYPIKKKLSLALKETLLSLVVVSSVIAVIFFCLVTYHWNTKVIRGSQPVICFILLGVMLGIVRITTGAMDIDTDLCIQRVWFGHLSLIMVMFTLVVKAFRVYRILHSPNFKRVVFDIPQSLVMYAGVLSFVALYIAIFVKFGKPEAKVHITYDNLQATYSYECRDENPNYATALYVLEGLLLGLSVFMSYKMKDAPDFLSESHYIAFGKIMNL